MNNSMGRGTVARSLCRRLKTLNAIDLESGERVALYSNEGKFHGVQGDKVACVEDAAHFNDGELPEGTIGALVLVAVGSEIVMIKHALYALGTLWANIEM